MTIVVETLEGDDLIVKTLKYMYCKFIFSNNGYNRWYFQELTHLSERNVPMRGKQICMERNCGLPA